MRHENTTKERINSDHTRFTNAPEMRSNLQESSPSAVIKWNCFSKISHVSASRCACEYIKQPC